MFSGGLLQNYPGYPDGVLRFWMQKTIKMFFYFVPNIVVKGRPIMFGMPICITNLAASLATVKLMSNSFSSGGFLREQFTEAGASRLVLLGLSEVFVCFKMRDDLKVMKLDYMPQFFRLEYKVCVSSIFFRNAS